MISQSSEGGLIIFYLEAIVTIAVLVIFFLIGVFHDSVKFKKYEMRIKAKYKIYQLEGTFVVFIGFIQFIFTMIFTGLIRSIFSAEGNILDNLTSFLFLGTLIIALNVGAYQYIYRKLIRTIRTKPDYLFTHDKLQILLDSMYFYKENQVKLTDEKKEEVELLFSHLAEFKNKYDY